MKMSVVSRVTAGLLLALTVVDAGAQQPAPARSITLEEARRLALNVNPASVAARNALAIADWERRAANANLFTPSVTATAGFTRFSDPFFNFGTGAITPNATSATLEARYVVLGGGKLSERRRASASIASASAMETATHFDVTLAADAAYYDVVVETELARVAANRVRRAQEQLTVARVRVQAGDALASDSLQLLLQLNRARAEVLRRDSALSVARLRLGNVTGSAEPVDAAALPASANPPLPLTLQAATSDLLSRGPAVEAARAEERRARAVWSGEREGYLPELSLAAVTGRYDSRFFPSALGRSQFSLQVSWHLWDSGRRELQISRARSQAENATAVREASERAVGEHMAQAYRGYETALAEITLATEAVEVATENHRVHSVRYREGGGMILDVLQAQADLDESEASLVRARHSARMALARIETLLGRRLFE